MQRTSRTVFLAVVVAVAACGVAFGAGQEEPAAAMDNVPSDFNATGLPIVDESATINVAVNRPPYITKEYNSFEKLIWLEEQTNVHVEWVTLSGDNVNQQINLMFASGDTPDVFLRNTLNTSQKLEFGEEGLLVELSDLIEQYGENIQYAFKLVPAAEAAAREIDGSIYALPEIRPWGADFWASPNVWGINNAWLEQLGLDMPTTTEELYEVLLSFKTEDPNGNGLTDEVPIITQGVAGNQGTPANLWYLFAAFGLEFDKQGFMVRDGQVVSTYILPEMKDALEYVHRLYIEGLINEDVFTIQPNEVQARVRQIDPIIVGALSYWSMSNVLGIPRFRDNDEFKHLRVVEGPEGKQILPVTPDGRVTPNGAFVTAGAEYPPLALRWLDYMYDERANLELNGPLTWIDDTTAKLADVPEGMTGAEFRNNTIAPKNSMPAVNLGDRYKKVPGSIYGVTERKNYTHLHEGMYPAEQLPSSLSFVTADEAKELNRLWVPIKEYFDRKVAEFVTKGLSSDDWDDFVATANRMGVAEVTEIRQREFERFREVMGGETVPSF